MGAFPDKVRVDVRRKAAFQCCRCHEIGVEAHHIVPASEGGSDDFENAAPLCGSCHSLVGANPRKRKEIRQMRDWWYEVVAEKYPVPAESEERLNDALVNAQADDARSDLNAVVDELSAQVEALKADYEKSHQARQRQLQEVATGVAQATRLGKGVYGGFECKKCGTRIGLLIGSDNCPNCGEPIG